MASIKLGYIHIVTSRAKLKAFAVKSLTQYSSIFRFYDVIRSIFFLNYIPTVIFIFGRGNLQKKKLQTKIVK